MCRAGDTATTDRLTIRAGSIIACAIVKPEGLAVKQSVACVVEEELIDDLEGEVHTVAVLFTLGTGDVYAVIWALSLLTWRTDPVTTARVTAWAACAEAISKAW